MISRNSGSLTARELKLSLDQILCLSHPEVQNKFLVKLQSLVQNVSTGAQDSAFLKSSQVLRLLGHCGRGGGTLLGSSYEKGPPPQLRGM